MTPPDSSKVHFGHDGRVVLAYLADAPGHALAG